MDYRRLGKSGLKVSQLCLGMMTYSSTAWRDWTLNEEQTRPLMKQAVEGGINFFDTADVYAYGGSEEITGTMLREFFPRRDDYVLATKVYNPMSDKPNDGGLSRKHILASIDASLKRLGTDYVDLYQIHRADSETPIEETLEALNDVVRAGKALYIGASSMRAWQFMKMLETQRRNGWAQFITMQGHYNLVYREEEREMNPLCIEEGIGLIPWSPLARGFLAGNRKRDAAAPTTRAASDAFAHSLYYGQSDFDVVDRVTEIAEARGVKNAQIALAWVMSRPGISAPIIGASKPYQMEDALAALSIQLTPEEVAKLEEAYQPHPVMGMDVVMPMTPK